MNLKERACSGLRWVRDKVACTVQNPMDFKNELVIPTSLSLKNELASDYVGVLHVKSGDVCKVSTEPFQTDLMALPNWQRRQHYPTCLDVSHLDLSQFTQM